MTPTRPVLRYFGGKWKAADWIISHFPEHRTYVESFGGAGSVLMRKPPSIVEVWNDTSDEMWNLFRVLRDPHLSSELIRLLSLTPFSRTEWEACYEYSQDPVEQWPHCFRLSEWPSPSEDVLLLLETSFEALTVDSMVVFMSEWLESNFGAVVNLYGHDYEKLRQLGEYVRRNYGLHYEHSITQDLTHRLRFIIADAHIDPICGGYYNYPAQKKIHIESSDLYFDSALKKAWQMFLPFAPELKCTRISLEALSESAARHGCSITTNTVSAAIITIQSIES